MKKYYLYTIALVLVLICFFIFINDNRYKKSGINKEDKKIFYKITNDEVVYLNDYNHSVALVKELISGHSKMVDTRNYKRIDFDLEYEFYTKQFINKIMNNEVDIVSFYEQHSLVTKHSSVVFNEVAFNDALTEATAHVTDQFRIEEVAQGSELEAYKGKIFSQERIYNLVFVDDVWKVNGISSEKRK